MKKSHRCPGCNIYIAVYRQPKPILIYRFFCPICWVEWQRNLCPLCSGSQFVGVERCSCDGGFTDEKYTFSKGDPLRSIDHLEFGKVPKGTLRKRRSTLNT